MDEGEQVVSQGWIFDLTTEDRAAFNLTTGVSVVILASVVWFSYRWPVGKREARARGPDARASEFAAR